jgi:hypothetical protein
MHTASCLRARANSRAIPQQQQQQLSCKPLHGSVTHHAEARGRQVVVARIFGNKGSTNRQQQPPGSAGPTQQQQIDLEQLRQQGGYNYPPPPPSSQQQQQQPWQWDQNPQQQQESYQQGAYGPPGGPATQTGSGGTGSGSNGGGNNGSDGGGLSGYTKALIAAAFVTGLGAGVYFDAEINLSPNQVASTEIIDRRTPNAEVCMAYGYSAMVFDQRVFVTYNPFNLYVTQPEVRTTASHGCTAEDKKHNAEHPLGHSPGQFAVLLVISGTCMCLGCWNMRCYVLSV